MPTASVSAPLAGSMGITWCLKMMGRTNTFKNVLYQILYRAEVERPLARDFAA